MTRRYLTDEQEALIAARYVEGATVKALVAEFGGTEAAVGNALRRQCVPSAGGRRKTRPLTPEQEAEIISRYIAGERVKPLAKAFNRRGAVISELLARTNTPIRPSGSHTRFTDDEAKAIVTAYQAGASLNALAAQYDSNAKTIRMTILRLGGTMREVGRDPFWTDDVIEQVVDLYKSGLSQQKIADRLGVKQPAISQRLYEAGVTPKLRMKRERHPSWKGGRRVQGGYVMVNPKPGDLAYCTPSSTGYVLEHRLVMARALGRPLLRSESVHHINGDRQDNRLTNLQLRQGAHGKGARFVCLDCGSHNVGAVQI